MGSRLGIRDLSKIFHGTGTRSCGELLMEEEGREKRRVASMPSIPVIYGTAGPKSPRFFWALEASGDHEGCV